jgi:hypothetical protein
MTDQQSTASTADTCMRCGGALHSMGVEKFRVGGTSGGWKLLFGEMASVPTAIVQIAAVASGVEGETSAISGM